MVYCHLTAVLVTLLYVVCPSKAQFSAFTAINGVVNKPNIGFTTLVTSSDSDLIRNVGAFRASRPGLYFFSFSALSAENVGFRISLRKNRQQVVTGFADSQGFNTATMSCVVQLNPGDLFYPYLEEGALYESRQQDRSYTTFTGFELNLGGAGWGGPDPRDPTNFFGGFVGRSATGSDQVQAANDTVVENLPNADPEDNILQLVQQEEAKKGR